MEMENFLKSLNFFILFYPTLLLANSFYIFYSNILACTHLACENVEKKYLDNGQIETIETIKSQLCVPARELETKYQEICN